MSKWSEHMLQRQRETPWGHADQVTEKARGIVFYSTPSHGGFHLDRERQAAIQRAMPDFKPFTGAPWYEEDCDAAVVAAFFHEAFSAREVAGAVAMIRAMAHMPRYVPVSDWLDSPCGAAAYKKAEQAEKAIA
jgi:hypothetical protein